MVNINKLRQMEKAKKEQKAGVSKQDKSEPIAQPPKQVTVPPEKIPAGQKEPTSSKSKAIITEKIAAPAPSPTAPVGTPSLGAAPASVTEKQVTDTEAQKKPQDEQKELHAEETKELITFRLNGRLFGIFVDKVHSVVKPTFITRLPHVEDYLIGIMNLRGIITPIYDLKCRFGIGRAELTNQSRILILELEDNLVGFIVDEIATLHNIKISDIQATPEIALGINQNYIKGVVTLAESEDLILVLALEEIVRLKGRVKISA